MPVQGKTFEASLRILPDTDNGTPVAVWDLNSGKRVALLTAETGGRGVAFSPDGKYVGLRRYKRRRHL